MLLNAFGLWWCCSPRLLRGKRDQQHFVSDIVVARDRSTAIEICRSPPFTPKESAVFAKRLSAEELAILGTISKQVTDRGAQLGYNAGEYEYNIPTALGFYSYGRMSRGPFSECLSVVSR